MGRLRLAVLCIVSAAACAPVYIPASANIPLLQKARDIHIAANGGTQGAQVNGAFAFTDHLAARGTLQLNATSEGDYYRSGTLGVGYFWAGMPAELAEGEFPSGLRASVNLDTGGALARAQGSDTISIDGEPIIVHYSGRLLRTSLQADIAWEWRYFAIGLAAKASHINFLHDAQSQRMGEVANYIFAEPVLFLRAGRQPIQLEAQLGIAFPLWGEGVIGVPPPILLSLGLVTDF